MPSFHTQVAIVGGGICGLWLLNAVRRAGHNAVLIERASLGGAQTLASQGMIHGGIKYALGGFTTPSSETIASMPARWRDCLAGSGSMDLRGVELLSSDYYLFSDQRLSSKITAFFGSKSLRGRVQPVSRSDYPPLFANERFKGTVYRLEDIVLDTDSLLRKLAEMGEGCLYQAEPRVVTESSGEIQSLELGHDVTLTADRYIFAAGAGNETLISETSLKSIAMQRRPLNQVMVRHAELPSIYAHAVAVAAGAKPRVTITTHSLESGDPVWYLGGNLAEDGVGRSDDEQIAIAQKEMQAIFPWFDWQDAEWATLAVDRAEPARKDRSRPDSPSVNANGNGIVCWPTKLTLTPLLADEVLTLLSDLAPSQQAPARLPLPAPPISPSPWALAFP